MVIYNFKMIFIDIILLKLIENKEMFIWSLNEKWFNRFSCVVFWIVIDMILM